MWDAAGGWQGREASAGRPVTWPICCEEEQGKRRRPARRRPCPPPAPSSSASPPSLDLALHLLPAPSSSASPPSLSRSPPPLPPCPARMIARRHGWAPHNKQRRRRRRRLDYEHGGSALTSTAVFVGEREPCTAARLVPFATVPIARRPKTATPARWPPLLLRANNILAL